MMSNGMRNSNRMKTPHSAIAPSNGSSFSEDEKNVLPQQSVSKQ